MKRRRRFCGGASFIGFFLLVIIFVVVIFCMFWKSGTKDKQDLRQLPKLSILLNDVSLDEVNKNDKTVKYPNNTVILTNGDLVETWSDVEIKGRGNSTWGMKKKPYRLKFENKVDLLGLGRTKKWALLANYIDDSMLRNDVAFFIARMLFDGFVPEGEFVELEIDNEKLGLYYLTEVISISKNIVDLKDQLGILVELDNLYCDNEPEKYIAKSGDCIAVKDVVSYDNKEEAVKTFMDKFNALEKAARKGDYETVKKKADVESLAKYFIISELTNNPDAYEGSWWFYVDGVEDVIHAGPVWDYDFALGNKEWGEPIGVENFYDPMTILARKPHTISDNENNENVSYLIYQLLEMPEFRDLVGQIYNERLEGRGDEVISYICERAEYLRESIMEDSEMWGKGDFDEEVEYLVWWVENRFRMMDAEYGNKVLIPIETKKI